MPFKFHASRRHHITRAKYRVMNWPDYDRGLVRRGDIRFWIDESALEQWDAAKRRTPGGQRRFSELAISNLTLERSTISPESATCRGIAAGARPAPCPSRAHGTMSGAVLRRRERTARRSAWSIVEPLSTVPANITPATGACRI